MPYYENLDITVPENFIAADELRDFGKELFELLQELDDLYAKKNKGDLAIKKKIKKIFENGFAILQTQDIPVILQIKEALIEPLSQFLPINDKVIQ